MTFRAVNVLRSVQTIAAEDTRHTRTLLSHFGLGDRRLVSLHEHNEAGRTEELLSAVADGGSLALVSDAGTPLVSDPGTLLVREAWSRGLKLVPVVGASAVSALMSVSPFGASGLHFSGFLPARPAARDAALLVLSRSAGPVFFFEAPHRIVSTVEALARLLPRRRLLVGRELTKLHEQLLLGTAQELLPTLRGEHRGEFVCALEGAAGDDTSGPGMDGVGRTQVIEALRSELPPRALARVIARLFGETARSVYAELTAGSQKD